MREWTDERVGQAMREYADQQNSELLAKIAQLENSYSKFTKERDEQYGEYIDLNVSLRNENVGLRERVKELESSIEESIEIFKSQLFLEHKVNCAWEELVKSLKK